MNKKIRIMNELKNYFNVSKIKNLHEIQDKNGIILYRFTYDNERLVIKYFESEAYRREIFYYQLLSKISVPTIKVHHYSKHSLILEDINASKIYRLGKLEDLSNPKIAYGLIKWYKNLHQNSQVYIEKHPELLKELYSEYDLVTKEIIEDIIKQTNSKHYLYWDLLLKWFDEIKQQVKIFTNCLTYNDFYYTNFIVSYDEEEVIMYDYNLLGKGFVYSDIRNVLASLKGEAREVFKNIYNNYHRITKAIDDVLSIIFTLSEAYKRDIFPNWATDELQKIYDGTMESDVNYLINLLKEKNRN